MTKAEYEALYRAAKNTFPQLTTQALVKLKNIYQQAGRDLAERILAAEMKNLSELTTNSWRAIETQLDLSRLEIQNALDAQIQANVTKGTRTFSRINHDYFTDVLDDSGERITESGLSNMFSVLDKRVIASVINRIFQDGYVYSDRIWRAAAQYGDDMKNIISAGLAQGRDIVKIAKDIQVYIKDDKVALVGRYGELKRGSREFIRRIGNRVDYRALRLLRSELYASMQDAAKLAARFNPACTGMVNWVRGGSQDWGCSCPEYAEQSPWELEKVPGFPHPNCLCRLVPVLRPLREFIGDLKEWARGGSVDYIDDWYKTTYLASA